MFCIQIILDVISKINKIRVEILEDTYKMGYLFKLEIEQILALSGLSLINGQEWLSNNELDFSTSNGCFMAENK